jgi:very-short-patch-repair endonuclease
LRDRRLGGFKFRRQQPLGRYTADFYCAEVKLIVELDGRSHADRRERDAVRDDWMRSEGVDVLRVPVWEFSKYKYNVLRNILWRCRERAGVFLEEQKRLSVAGGVRPLTRSACADRPLPQGER